MNRTQAHLQRLGGLFYNVAVAPGAEVEVRCLHRRRRLPQLLVRRARGARATAAGKPGALGQDRRRKGDHRPLHTALWSSFRRPLFRLGANNAGSEC
ncbi:hypothetical protein GQ55_2G316600 [Panicum hallii var. hallii]|uniref:Uncharacterized protein n=1 Tax=Panicum hallii var. hallii TaxID=1504633 RepID=A0A2T7EUJ0_9POAL|nr:hypothetical protein GQ55_2G316600 [Panicum hallii var. hallii]